MINLDRLELGAAVVVQSGCILHCGGLEWSQERGSIRIGSHTYIGHNCVLYGAGELHIGSDVLVGPGAIITSQGHGFEPGMPIRLQPYVLEPVHIGDDVWIGAGAVVLPGVSVGQGAVVAAGAVVSKNVEPFHVVAGVPARTVRLRDGGERRGKEET